MHRIFMNTAHYFFCADIQNCNDERAQAENRRTTMGRFGAPGQRFDDDGATNCEFSSNDENKKIGHENKTICTSGFERFRWYR